LEERPDLVRVFVNAALVAGDFKLDPAVVLAGPGRPLTDEDAEIVWLVRTLASRVWRAINPPSMCPWLKPE